VEFSCRFGFVMQGYLLLLILQILSQLSSSRREVLIVDESALLGVLWSRCS
jgi:hypothetical protein